MFKEFGNDKFKMSNLSNKELLNKCYFFYEYEILATLNKKKRKTDMISCNNNIKDIVLYKKQYKEII